MSEKETTVPPADLDLASLDLRAAAEVGVEVQLHHPGTGQALAAWIRVQGADSRAYQDTLAKIRRATRTMLDEAKRTERTPEEMEQDASTMAAALTLGWRSAAGAWLTLEGEQINFSAENAKRVYQRFGWIREQLEGVVFNRGKFLPG